MEKPKAKAADWKKEKISLIKSFLEKHKTIGIIDATSLPSSQMQKMRSQLKAKGMNLVMTRMRLIKRAIHLIKDSKKNILELEPYIKGIPAIIFLNDNPFKLAKFISKNKGSAPAKPGQIAPSDLYVPAGPTPFTPGPIIGELGSLGIKTSIEAGKISIKDATRIVKQGDVISEKAATILAKLGIEPMEIGMNLVAAYEDGTIYSKEVLSINEKELINNIKKAHRESLNLALNTAIPVKEVISMLIKKAYLDGLGLSKKINFEINKGITKQEPEVKKETPLKEIKQIPETITTEKEFKENEQIAQNILKNLQDQKLRGE